jgi:hypothetical protein
LPVLEVHVVATVKLLEFRPTAKLLMYAVSGSPLASWVHEVPHGVELVGSALTLPEPRMEA